MQSIAAMNSVHVAPNSIVKRASGCCSHAKRTLIHAADCFIFRLRLFLLLHFFFKLLEALLAVPIQRIRIGAHCFQSPESLLVIIAALLQR